MTEKIKKPLVYIETSVISYYTSKLSPNVKVLADQLVTKEWWEKILPLCDARISTYVYDEITKGNSKEVEKRIKAVEGIEFLSSGTLVEQLALEYLKKLSIPKKADVDAYHLAIAAIHEVDFLVSWNCKHIANGFKYPTIKRINDKYQLRSPDILTPLSLMEV